MPEFDAGALSKPRGEVCCELPVIEHRNSGRRRQYRRRMDAGDWISLAGVIVAAVVAVVSAVWAVRAARRADAADERAEQNRVAAQQQAERAAQAAEQAAAAEVESARAAERSAAALEEQNRRAEEAAAAAEGVPWRIAYQTGSRYELWNDSDTPKYYVQISGEGVLRGVSRERVDGRSPVEFMGLDAMGVGNEVQVTWYRRQDRSGEPLTWTGIKPARR